MERFRRPIVDNRHPIDRVLMKSGGRREEGLEEIEVCNPSEITFLKRWMSKRDKGVMRR